MRLHYQCIQYYTNKTNPLKEWRLLYALVWVNPSISLSTCCDIGSICAMLKKKHTVYHCSLVSCYRLSRVRLVVVVHVEYEIQSGFKRCSVFVGQNETLINSVVCCLHITHSDKSTLYFSFSCWRTYDSSGLHQNGSRARSIELCAILRQMGFICLAAGNPDA